MMRAILATFLIVTAALVGCSRDELPTPDPLLASRWLLEIEPLLEAEVLRLDSIPDTCAGPYWVVEDVLVLE